MDLYAVYGGRDRYSIYQLSYLLLDWPPPVRGMTVPADPDEAYKFGAADSYADDLIADARATPPKLRATWAGMPQDWFTNKSTEWIVSHEAVVAYCASKNLRPQFLYPSPPKSEKHQERHARLQVEILGAALAVLATFPADCKNTAGQVQASKLAYQIDQRAHFFWPDNAQPSLTLDTTTKLLTKWLSKTKTRK